MIKFITRFLVFYFSLFAGTISLINAQGEGNVWVFGNHNGLDFNQSPPAFIQTSSQSLESSASICDAAGNLIFYTNGNTVWNAEGDVVQDGTGLLGNGGSGGLPASTTQGVNIVKSIANPNQYYVFVLSSAEEWAGGNTSYLRYSVVDMSTNNGEGAVLPTQKNIILDSNTSEKMALTTGLGCSYWLLIHSNNSAEYHAFKIDANGIDTNPVVSTGIWTGDMNTGQMKFSNDGTQVACGINLVNTSIELASFDKASGQLSNFYSLPTPTPPQSGSLLTYGLCFSPDDNYLYHGTFGYLFQYDLSLMPDVNAMANAVYTYPVVFSASSLRQAPDGKIYVANFSQPFIACIENPNVYGAGSNLNITALAQPAWAIFASWGTFYGYGLGAEVVIPPGTDTLAHQVFDTMLCDPEVSLTASAGFGAYIWDDGSTGQTKTVTESGTYYVYLLEPCGVQVDSFHVNFINVEADLGQDTFICSGATLLLETTPIPGATYLWQDGSTDSELLVSSAGTYSVQTSLNGCHDYDTVLVEQIVPEMYIVQNDTSVCMGDVVNLTVIANPESNLWWSTGSAAPGIEVSEAGTYAVSASNVCGNFTDSFTLNTFNCNCLVLLPTAFSPNGDGKNDEFKPVLDCEHSLYKLLIFNRWGQKVFEANNATQGWDGNFNGVPAELGSYYYFLELTTITGTTEFRKGDFTLIR